MPDEIEEEIQENGTEEIQAPEASSRTLEGGGEGYPVMEIDMSGDAATIAKEKAEATIMGIPIVYKNEPKAKAKEEVKEEEEEEEGSSEENEHPLAKVFFGKKDKKEEEEVEVPDSVSEWFKGQGVDDPRAVLDELPSLRQGLVDLQKEVDQKNADLGYLSKLSPEALNVIQMELDGKDWKKEVAVRPSLDFRISFAKQNKEKVLGAYSKGRVTEEQWEDYSSEDPDPSTKAYVDAVLETAEVKYNLDAEKSNNYLKESSAKATARNEAIKNSTDAVMKELVRTTPGAAAHEKRIRSLLTPDAVLGMFFNDDGSLKPSAALDAWLVADREMLMSSKTKRIETQAKNDAIKKTLRRTDEKRVVPAKGAKESDDQASKSAEEKIRGMFERAGVL